MSNVRNSRSERTTSTPTPTSTTTSFSLSKSSSLLSSQTTSSSYGGAVLRYNNTTTTGLIKKHNLLHSRSLNDCTSTTVNYQQQVDTNNYQNVNDDNYSNEKIKVGTGLGAFTVTTFRRLLYTIRRITLVSSTMAYEPASTNDTSTDNDDFFDDDDDDQENDIDNSNDKITTINDNERIQLRRIRRQNQPTQQSFPNRLGSIPTQSRHLVEPSSPRYCSYKVLFFVVSFLLLSLILQLALTSIVISSTNDNKNETSTSLLYSLLTGTIQSISLSSSSSSSCNKTDTTATIPKLSNSGPTTGSSSSSSILEQNENVLLTALVDDIDRDGDFVVIVPSASTSSSTTKNITAGVVASDQKICSELGVSILQRGGNAIDAAVTTALCIGIVNPSSSGIGGGGFMLILSDPINNSTTTRTKKQSYFYDSRDQQHEPVLQIVNNKIKQIEVIDCREVAPSHSYVNMYSTTTQPRASVLGGLAIPVPGELRGLQLAHERHGILSWKQVVEPVVTLADNGIIVSKYLAHVIADIATKMGGDNRNKNKNKKKKTKKTIRRKTQQVQYNETWGIRNFITHGNNWDTPLLVGDVMKNPILVSTLIDIMNNGADALYTGHRAEQLANDIQNAGGIVTVDDLNAYHPTIRTPVVSTPDVNGFAIVGVPPPSSGGAVIIGALRFLSGFVQPLSTYSDTVSIHRIIESMKHAFAIRMSLSDPLYNTNTVTDAVHDLVYGPYMDKLRQLYYNDDTTIPSLHHYGGTKWSLLDENEGENVTAIDANEGDRRRHRRRSRHRHLSEHFKEAEETKNDIPASEQEHKQQRARHRKLYRSHGHLEDSGTSHFSIVDKDGNAVSMTTSINTVFGSMVVSPSTGILLGNTMDDFANPGVQDFFGIKPSEANYIQPGKKPLSSMSPTFIFEQAQQSIVDPTNDENDSSSKQNQAQPYMGKLILAIGGSGGPKIITAVLQVILNHIYLGKNLLESIIHPRVHNQLVYHGSSVTMLEKATLDHIITNIENDVLIEISNRTRDALVRRQHQLGTIEYTGCVQAIAIDLDTGTMTGASDVRKGGAPAGL